MEVRDDVLASFTGMPSPVDSFAAAVGRAVEARARELRGLEREVAEQETAAVTEYERGLELNPADGALRRALAILRSQMGIRYMQRQKFTAGYGFAREAVEVDPTYAQGFANLGQALLLHRSFDYALSVADEALALEPEDDLFHSLVGRIWKSRGYYDKAVPAFERALALNPANVPVAIALAESRLELDGKYADHRAAAEFLRGIVPLAPDDEDLRAMIVRLELAATQPARSDGGPESAAAEDEGTGDEETGTLGDLFTAEANERKEAEAAATPTPGGSEPAR